MSPTATVPIHPAPAQEAPPSPCRLTWLEAGGRSPGYYVIAHEATDEPGESQIFAQVRDPHLGMMFAQSHALLAIAEDVVELARQADADGALCLEDWRKLVGVAQAVIRKVQETPPQRRRSFLSSPRNAA
jgi:hypothetical protein